MSSTLKRQTFATLSSSLLRYWNYSLVIVGKEPILDTHYYEIITIKSTSKVINDNKKVIHIRWYE